MLETAEDMAWLRDVHAVNIEGIACAILVGNEDSPTRIELYRTPDNYQSLVRAYEADEAGALFLVPRS